MEVRVFLWLLVRMGHAGKLIKIDGQILGVRLQLRKTPRSRALKSKLEELLKEREDAIALIERDRRKTALKGGSDKGTQAD